MSSSNRRHSMAPVNTSPSRIPSSPNPNSSSGIPTRLSHRSSMSFASSRTIHSPTPPVLGPPVESARPGSAMGNSRRPASTPLTKTLSEDALGKADVEAANVQVVLRIRPSQQPDQSIPARFTRTVLVPSPSNPHTEVSINLSNDSTGKQASGAVPSSGSGSSMASGNKGKQTSFRYDRVLGEESEQSEVFEYAGKMAVDKFIAGVNVTVLAYGQTSSGKSFTMGTTGIENDYISELNAEQNVADRIGMIPRAMSEIFSRAEAKKNVSGAGATWECRLSFLELYNEELIDLLSNLPQAQSPPIVIREDKGRILWSGLKDVHVSNTAEVMKYLKEGSNKRRTGETGMNKESSRSHAIFSLTLVQTRRSSDGASGKNRPMSTPGPPTSMRSPTPSGIRTPNRTSMLARGLNGRMTPAGAGQDEDGSWVETSSKFHFVDLAGSERLKRTGAGGDRMKEGISINAGLLALGNVISALADPAKAKSSHIPYRDSKLTRLLQDSLGGNAFTVMIACVSPIEYNLNETLNTLKYGARARNIKNRAEVNEVEVGWDDIEHLQSTVMKLRAELTRLKSISGASDRDVPVEASDDVHRELQETRTRLRQVEDEHDLASPAPRLLQDEVQGKSLQIARLVTDLEATKNAGSFNPEDVTAFSKLVEPIVEEYERLIQALEGKLQATLASLELSQERALEAEELASQKEQRMARQEAYVTDLVNRLNRLKDKEKTFDEYITDLEDKLRNMEDLDSSHQQTLTALRTDLIEEKKQSQNASDYIAAMEAAVAQSETETKSLTRKIERLETELKRKEDIHLELQERIKLVDTTEDNQLLLRELEEKNTKMADLERQLEDTLHSSKVIGEERDNLRQITTRQARDLEALKTWQHEQDLVKSQTTTSNPPSKLVETMDVSRFHETAEDDSPEKVPGSPTSPAPGQYNLADGQIRPGSMRLAPEVIELQEKHQSTLAELATISDRYKEALEKITELTGQVIEAEQSNLHVQHQERDSAPPTPSISRTTSTLSVDEQTSGSPRIQRRTQSVGNNLLVQTGKTDFHSGRGDRKGDARPYSLSQELSSSRLSLSSFGSATSLLSPISNTRQNLPSRSTTSLEAEIRQLQEVLRRRDDEIRVLETAIRSLSGTSPRYEYTGNQAMYNKTNDGEPMVRDLSSTSTVTFGSSLPRTPEDQDVPDPLLTPTTNHHFGVLRQQIHKKQGNDEVGDLDQVDRLDTLMRSMAKRELEHKKQIDDLNNQLRANRVPISQLKRTDELSTPKPTALQSLPENQDGIPAVSSLSHKAPLNIDKSIQVNELEQSIRGISTAIHEVVLDYGLDQTSSSLDDPMDGIDRLASALAEADETETILRAELAQLRTQNAEAAELKLSLESTIQQKEERDVLIKDLERKLQDVTLATRRQSQNSDSDRDPANTVTSRMSYGRSATPTAKIPPLQPPPSIPPPPLPALPEGLPSPALRNPAQESRSPREPKSRPASPKSPLETSSAIEGSPDKIFELLGQISNHEKTIGDLQGKLQTAQFSMKENTDTIQSLTNNLQSSDRNLRKLRLQAVEHTRERDLAKAEVLRLEEELAAAKNEVTSVRNSVISEKRSLEDRLSEERRAKERTRAQLEERLEAAQQKQSKFRCF